MAQQGLAAGVANEAAWCSPAGGAHEKVALQTEIGPAAAWNQCSISS